MGKRSKMPEAEGTGYSVHGAAEEHLGGRTAERARSVLDSDEGRPKRHDPRSDGEGTPRAERAFGGGVTAVKRPPTIPVRSQRGKSPELRATQILDELGRCGPGDEAPFVVPLRNLGDVGLRALEEAFPGLLWFDRNLPHQRPPRGRAVSPIASLLHGWGIDAVPVLTRLLRREDADDRFYALLLAIDLDQPSLVPAIGELLFDEEPSIREQAVHGLSSLQRHDAYNLLVKRIRSRLPDPRFFASHRLLAIQALAALRDAPSVPLLVPMLEWIEPGLPEVVHAALRTLTAHDLGRAPKDWKKWIDKNQAKPRTAWLLAAAGGSDIALRDFAFHELARETGKDLGHVPGSDSRTAARVRKQYEQIVDRGR